MKKILNKKIGWSNLSYNDEMFEEKNNNWFIINDFDVEDEIIEKLYEDKRVIVNKKWECIIVNINNVDAIETEYGVECESILDNLDTCYGDWEQDYDTIGENIGIGEHEAYELVGDNIAEILETIALRINTMTEEQIKEINYDDISFIRDGLFFKSISEDRDMNFKRLKDKYKEFLS